VLVGILALLCHEPPKTRLQDVPHFVRDAQAQFCPAPALGAPRLVFLWIVLPTGKSSCAPGERLRPPCTPRKTRALARGWSYPKSGRV
jgi:hypothetical protein